MTLIELPAPVSDVRTVLEECLEMADGLDSVVVLGLTKVDRCQVLRTSSMSAADKAFLSQFLNAYVIKWFKLEDH